MTILMSVFHLTAEEAMRLPGLFLSAAMLYLLPGGVVVVWLLRDGDWIERLIAATGLSLALNGLLVYATWLGFRLNAAIVVGFLLLCGAGIILRWLLDWRQAGWRIRPLLSKWTQWARDPWQLGPAAALAVVFVFVLGVRLYVVHGLPVAMWGDGYQHTMIAQLLVDNGGLFDSWEPYAPLTTFTYHFGFHANAALFHWVSGESLTKSVIWVGQFLNALAVLALYPLAVKVSGGRRWAGVGAVLVAGLLSPMPSYYVNWSRYTQLAGQVLLVVAAYLTWSYLEVPRRNGRPYVRAILAWIAVGGLAITHYRVLLFYALFVLAVLLVFWRKEVWQLRLGRAALLAVGLFVLFAPWLVRIAPGTMARVFLRQVTTAAKSVSAYNLQYNALPNLTLFMAPWLWLLLAVSLCVGLWRRQRGALLMAVWWLGLVLATNPHWIFLPGTGAITNFALFIAVYIPTAILAGSLVGWLAGALSSALKGRAAWAVALGGICVVLLAGSTALHRRVEDVQVAAHSLVLVQDLEAMDWIRENTAPDARFLINSFPAYDDSLVVGSDGGWWMPLLAGRANSVPPLNYGAEQGPSPDYTKQVNELTFKLQEMELNAPATVRMLCERGFTHVYIGQRQGRVNYSGPHVLSLDEMLRSPSYTLVYQKGEVAILEIACAAVH